MILIRVILYLTLFVENHAEEPDTSPNCYCPFGFHRSFPAYQYCGFELKQFNSNASKKVVQSNCKDNFLYKCRAPKLLAEIKDRCQHSCVTPTEELRLKYFPDYNAIPVHRWCVNLSESG